MAFTATTAHRRRLLTVLLAMLFMYQADATIVNVATPSIRSDLGASGAQLELVISGYLLASAALLITGARLGRMFGCRRLFLAGVAVFGAASLACGLAPDPVMLVVARVIQGIGGALAFPQVLTSIQLHVAAGPARARALSLYSAALAGGAVAGQILGGLLVSADLLGLRWRPVFLVNVPVTLVVLLAGARFLPGDDARDAARRLDVPGAVSLSAAVLLIVVPLALGRDAGWPAWTWTCLALSLPILAAFVAIERRQTAAGHSPLINLQVIRRPAIAWGLWPQAIAVSTYYALLFTLALYLQRGLGRSALFAGLTLLPWVVAFAVPGRVLGLLPARAQPLFPLAGCLILAGVYALISASMASGAHPEALLLALLALGGLGLGTNFSSILGHLTVAATPRYAADISGVFTTSMQIAGAVGVAAFGTLYLSQIAGPGPGPASRALGVTAAGFAFAALIAAATAYRATHSGPTELPRAARLHKTALVGQHDGLDPVPQAELGQDPAGVRLGDEEPGGDLGASRGTGSRAWSR